jgi:hypothetical protein
VYAILDAQVWLGRQLKKSLWREVGFVQQKTASSGLTTVKLRKKSAKNVCEWIKNELFWLIGR